MSKHKFKPNKRNPDGHITNDERADLAQGVLDEFIRSAQLANDSTAAALSDLIANLGHLADREEMDFNQLIQTGLMNWNHER